LHPSLTAETPPELRVPPGLREGGKRKRKAVGRDASHAENLARQRELSPAPAPSKTESNPMLAEAIAGYLAEIKATSAAWAGKQT
jgi:hypothetical protein